MAKILQAVAWWCFVPKLLAPEAFVRAVAEAGYAGIDLAPREYWPLVKDHGLMVSAIGGHGSITRGLNRREEHPRILAELREAIGLAQAWGIPNLILFSGNREGQSDAEGAKITALGLKEVAREAEAAGVTLVLELLNSKVDHPGYQADHTRWGVRVCEMVASERVKLLYDIYHMQVMEGDVIRTVQEHHPHIGHYHTAGNPGRHDLDDAQELNYPAILRAIRDTGFAGFVAHEFIPKGEPVQALRAAFRTCLPHL
jgi:hydroxypyruvate isomerase